MDRARALKQPVRQCRFAVIDVRDDAEVARELNRHEKRHYASAPLSGQLAPLLSLRAGQGTSKR